MSSLDLREPPNYHKASAVVPLFGGSSANMLASLREPEWSLYVFTVGGVVSDTGVKLNC